MIEFLNWWTESWWRVFFAVFILIGAWTLVHDTVVYITNAYVLKKK